MLAVYNDELRDTDLVKIQVILDPVIQKTESLYVFLGSHFLYLLMDWLPIGAKVG